jgi:serine/threonine protein kinase
MAVPQHIDRQTFLTHLRQSRLLTETQLASALRRLPDSQHGRAVARSLVEAGLLTRFQAERLLAGRNSFLVGPYRILDHLGRGGMGRVYKAEHVTMGRVVALKVLAPELLRTERTRTLFLREVRAAAQLVHPNVVTAYDASTEGDLYYLVLEYVDGPNLDQLVRSQATRNPASRGLPVGLACDYILQATQALQAAAALGMVHRDIKPANILVQRRGLDERSAGLIKVSDFGLARLQDPAAADKPTYAGTILARENTVVGTPDYLSPEQARDIHAADIRSDLYSLGCTFYFLLAGQPPFPGGTALEKLIRHGTESPTPIPTLRPDVPGPVAAIVARLLAKSPRDRFQTPAEVAAALEPFAVSGPTPWASLPSAPDEGSREVATTRDPTATPTGEPATDGCGRGVAAPPGAPERVSLDGSSDDLIPVITPAPLIGRVHTPAADHVREQGLRARKAVLWAAGIVLALLAAAAALSAFAGP